MKTIFYGMILFIFLCFSCKNKDNNIIIGSNELIDNVSIIIENTNQGNIIVEELIVEELNKSEINNEDIFWFLEMDGSKSYNIRDADEFRSKLPFYNYVLKRWSNQNSEKMINLNLSVDSVIYAIGKYLQEYDIFNELLMQNMVNAIAFDIEEDIFMTMFARMDVYYEDIVFGYFYFNYIFKTNEIVIQLIATDTSSHTYFYKKFSITNDSLIY
jgi:hypothetical protein